MSPQPLRADSPRRAHARRFGLALDRAIRVSGISIRALAAASGTSRSGLYFYREGVNLPTLDVAARIADILGQPALVAIVEEARSGTCGRCGRSFASTAGNGNRRYCSEDCRRVAYDRVNRHRPARDRAAVAERTASRYVEAVEAFCRSCEPDGKCHMPECELRIVSPLPLARSGVA